MHTNEVYVFLITLFGLMDKICVCMFYTHTVASLCRAAAGKTSGIRVVVGLDKDCLFFFHFLCVYVRMKTAQIQKYNFQPI